MELNEFKTKLDNREFYCEHSKEMYDSANKWAEQANFNNDNLCKWSWDCGLKLDYDGEICSINSRFYPPHKHHIDIGGYSGNISVYIGEKQIHKHEINAITLDELKMQTEKYCNDIIEKIKVNIEKIFI